MIERIKLIFEIWQIVHRLDMGGLWFVLELLDDMGEDRQRDTDYEGGERR